MYVANQGRMPKRKKKSLKDHEEVEPGQWLLVIEKEFRATTKGSLQQKQYFLAAAQKYGANCVESWNPKLKRGKRAILKGETSRAELRERQREREIEKIPISLRILIKIKGNVQDSKLLLGFSTVLCLFPAFLGFELNFAHFSGL